MEEAISVMEEFIKVIKVNRYENKIYEKNRLGCFAVGFNGILPK